MKSDSNLKLKCELLAPAGNLEKLATAVHYGADAVYLGNDRYSLRAHASMSADDIERAVSYAHERSVKVYATVNIIAHNHDLNGLGEYLRFLRDIEIDGLIISDPGILMTAGRLIPEVPVHLSTQANVTNGESAAFWENQGVSRINLARELTLAEIKTIKRAARTEIEVFVHGALCISYSGRCLLSYYMTGRNANTGDCAQPCRYRYALMEERRPGQFFAIDEDSRGTYILNSKDLCLLSRLPYLLEAGVDSLKIEGRMKGIYYVGGVVRVYRAALDYFYEHAGASPPGRGRPVRLPPEFMDELHKVGTRGYTKNFINGPPSGKDMIYTTPREEQNHILAGVIRSADGHEPLIEARNPIRPGDALEYMGRGLETFSCKVMTIADHDGVRLEQANPGTLIYLKTSPPPHEWEENALLRKTA